MSDGSYDRYVSFKGADWERKSAAIMTRLECHRRDATSPFWAYFFRQREQAHAQGFDDLRVLHNYVSTLRELLEDIGDEATLSLLEELEETCM
ncbi:N(2)-fixation sustaining protein CowN [Martelella alba]|uniref:N(2)-fixation sustaining protein CowN n=1 Tax=Martelella alba TaxID=2590451 RepID=A0A506UIK1_9HYPH|nr:N(2)-fixation sustaining protein CowN [Martelella alba]TPW33140.1 N(2)-fixation sustaining protein CowN [Martelella alba]